MVINCELKESRILQQKAKSGNLKTVVRKSVCCERYTGEAGNTILQQKLTRECNGDQVTSAGKDHKSLQGPDDDYGLPRIHTTVQ